MSALSAARPATCPSTGDDVSADAVLADTGSAGVGPLQRPALRLVADEGQGSGDNHRLGGAVIGQQTLPLEFCLPNGLPAIPHIAESVLRTAPESSVVPWAARLAQAVLEVVVAERPVTQLTTWVVPEVYRRLDRRHQARARQINPSSPRTRTAEHVSSVHVCHPTPDVAEVSVVCRSPQDPKDARMAARCRGLALRLERRKGRWICTELDWP